MVASGIIFGTHNRLSPEFIEHGARTMLVHVEMPPLGQGSSTL